MSIKFVILNTSGPAEKEGKEFVRFTGTAEPFNHVSERFSKEVGKDSSGNSKLMFVTGLDEEKVQFYNWYNDEEKKIVKKQIKELKPLIEKFYGGKEVLDSTNVYFWKKDRDINKLYIDERTEKVFYDTSRPDHALLYLSIIAGAFDDAVAPTKEWAIRWQTPHYLALESDVDNLGDDIEITKSDAHAELGWLKREQPEALFILAWCLQYETDGYGAYTKATSQRDLVTYHVKYINGNLQTKKKRNCPKSFLEYAERWKGTQTKPRLYTEAYVKAGEYYSFINQREKKFVTADGTVLGNTVEEAVDNLHKPKFQQDYEKLRELVEAKWAE